MMHYQYKVLRKEVCYQGFFRLDRYRIRHELFAGGWSDEIVRELLERGHAAAVLPYDPEGDSVVMIEQFRIGAMQTPTGPWLLEFVAGIIDHGEEPEQVVVREALEEMGSEVTDLVPILAYHVSPGGCSERIHLFCGRVGYSGAGTAIRRGLRTAQGGQDYVGNCNYRAPMARAEPRTPPCTLEWLVSVSWAVCQQL
jgi:ADP-ribose pyrophosphatase